MTERPQLQELPAKTVVAARDGTFNLQWLAWLGALLNWVQRTRVFFFTVDVPSIPSGGGWWGQFTCPGVVVGDFAVASLDPCDRDIAVSAQVTAAGVVTVWARNWGAGAIDLAPGTCRIWTQRAR